MKKQLEYYKNGIIKKEYYLNENKQLEGEFKEYYENGKVLVDCIYKDGKVEGEAKVFNENGDLFIKYYYENGQKISMIKVFKN